MPVYNKLVRDLIPDIIGAQGKQYTIKTLDIETYIIELRRKLQEEHLEYISAKTDQEASAQLYSSAAPGFGNRGNTLSFL
ncbi:MULTISPECIES: nucleoside triphosphate pyrophosphohydrolase [unclassified Paenibacillus]|uniref:nucleoside triphosphate pyrophosphohydrolase n=1 Tax=unclassified Paenibacillus TaxID=185978 RepID=UPI000839BC9C|nr:MULTISPECIES: nucleoside triphosphate pyrophosphohydrolase [unclassified Paenibacillus]